MLILFTTLFVAARREPAFSVDRVGSVAELVAEAGKALHEDLAVDPSLGRCMVYTRQKSGQEGEFLDHLALALGATWNRSKQSRRLERTPTALAELRSREERRIAAGIASYLAAGATLESRDAAFYERTLRENAAVTGNRSPALGPADGLLQDLLLAVGPKLATSAPYGFRLFSNRPTTAEEPLPGIVAAAISRYQKLEADLAERLVRVGSEDWDRYTYERVVLATQLARSAGVGRVLLSVYRTDTMLQVNLTTYTEAGLRRSWASAAIPLITPKLPTASFGTTPIVWPQESVDALSSIDESRGGNSGPKLLRPEQWDPLMIQAVPGLQSLAGREAPAVVPLPDLVVPTLFSRRPKTQREFASALSDSGVDVRLNDGWLSATLKMEGAIERLCLPRKSLQNWLKALQDPQQDAFLSTARLATACGDTISSSRLDDWYKESVVPKMIGRKVPETMIPRWLVFYVGSLSDTEWRELRDGHTIPIETSGNRSRWMIDWARSAARVLEPAKAASTLDVSLIGSYAFPGGVPFGSTLSMAPSNVTYIRAASIGPDWVPLDGLADSVSASIKNVSPEQVGNTLGAVDLGTQGTYAFRASFNPDYFIEASQPSGDLQSTQNQVTFSNWPESMRNSFVAQVEEASRLRTKGDHRTTRP